MTTANRIAPDFSLHGWPDADTLDVWAWLVSHRRNADLLGHLRAVVASGPPDGIRDAIGVALIQEGRAALLAGLGRVDWVAIAEELGDLGAGDTGG
jgi:hypothetical protein